MTKAEKFITEWYKNREANEVDYGKLSHLEIESICKKYVNMLFETSGSSIDGYDDYALDCAMLSDPSTVKMELTLGMCNRLREERQQYINNIPFNPVNNRIDNQNQFNLMMHQGIGSYYPSFTHQSQLYQCPTGPAYNDRLTALEAENMRLRTEINEDINQLLNLNGANSVYPLAIIKDRYDGTYSGGEYLAFNAEYIPAGVNGDDVECANFWNNTEMIVGRGSTPNEAVNDLNKRMEAKHYDLKK